eukprot:jgi/Mesvir1/13469/Mv16528-RA.1
MALRRNCWQFATCTTTRTVASAFLAFSSLALFCSVSQNCGASSSPKGEVVSNQLSRFQRRRMSAQDANRHYPHPFVVNSSIEQGGRVSKYWFSDQDNQRRLTWRDCIDLWRGAADQGKARADAFHQLFVHTLRDARYPAFFWECVPIASADDLSKTFEFVLVDAPSLAKVQADADTFAEHMPRRCLAGAGSPTHDVPDEDLVVAFPNLGRDATLVVPCPPAPDSDNTVEDYAHIAQFIRHAPSGQVRAFWHRIGDEIDRMYTGLAPRRKTLWVSTSGLGVYWLHVRLDSYPKYYNHVPYKTV